MKLRAPGAVLAAALLATTLASGVASSASAADGPVAEPELLEVAISSITPQVLHPEDTLTVVARVTNSTEEEIEEPVVRLHVNRFRVTDRAGVGAWADLSPQDPPGSLVATRALSTPLPAGASRDVRFRVPGNELGFLDLPDTWGPRGLAVSVADGATAGLGDVDRSFVLWMTAPAVPQTRISVLVPLTGNPVDVPAWTVANEQSAQEGEQAPEPEQDAENGAAGGTAGPLGAGVLGSEAIGPIVSAQGRLGAVLAATRTRPDVAYVLDPAVIAASRASQDEAAVAWVDELLASLDSRDIFALGWADPDVAALARGKGDVLLEGATRLTEERTPELLGRSARTDLAWPAEGLRDLETLGLLARQGTTAAVGAPGLLGPVDRAGTASATGRTTVSTEDGSVVVLVPDAGLVKALVEPVGSTPATVAQRLLAETAVIAREESTELRHLVIALPREWHPDPQLAGAQLDALEAAPWIDTTSVSTLLGSLDPSVDRAPLPTRSADEEMLDEDLVASLAERFAFARDFAPVLTDPETFLAQQAAQLLAPTAVAWRADPAGRADLAARVIEEARARTVGLSVVEGSDISFVAREGSVPVTVDNALAAEARVMVELRPDSGVLVAKEPVEAVVPPGEQATVWVPVQSVANGDVTIEVALLSPDGAPVAPTSSFTVRVRADWENVGTWIVTGLLAIGFVAGIVRTVRRGKTSTRVDAADVPELAKEAGE